MPITRFGFESGVNLDAATTANTGATTVFATGGSLAISTAWSRAGTRSLRGIATATSGVVYAQYTITATGALYVEVFLFMTGTPSAESGFVFVGTGATRQVSLAMTTARTIRVRDGGAAGGAAAYTSGVVPLNTLVKVCFFLTQNATTGTFRLAWSQTSPFGTFDSDSGTLTAQNTGAATYDSLRVGPKISTGTNTWDSISFDDFGYMAGGSGFPTVAPVIGGPLSQDPYVFLDMSLTTVDVGPVAFTASPSTGVVAQPTGLFLPAPTDGSTLTYTVTATDTGNAGTATTSVDVATSTGGVETLVWDGLSWGGDAAPTPPTATPMPTASYTSSVTGQKWTWIYGEDFLTPVALTGFTTMTTGPDTGLLDPASVGGGAYSNSWKAKTAESLDTSGNARYSVNKTTSVVGSVLDIWLHKAGAQAYGSAFKPIIPGADPNFLSYCRVEFRMRQTGVTGPGFGAVALLINNGQWPIWGEDDWPETQLGGLVGGFRHPAQATNTSIAVSGGGRSTTDYHRYFIEWFPVAGGARVRYGVDDVETFSTTSLVAVAPAILGFLIQTGSNGAAVPDGSSGHLELDWCAIWNWTP